MRRAVPPARRQTDDDHVEEEVPMEPVRARADAAGERRHPRRRTAVAALASVLALGGAGLAVVTIPAGAGEPGPTDDGGSPPAEVVIDEPTWEVRAETCDQLPDGAVITGEGHRFTSTEKMEDDDGSAVVTVTGVAFGTATDQEGNEYTWLYENVEKVTSSADDPGLYHGIMTDRFELIGGPLDYENGFEAVVTDDLQGTVFMALPLEVDGDPFDFDASTGRCDPI
jgi:hypothetical protein